MIISHKNPETKTIAVVYKDCNNVYIKFPEANEKFRRIVKGHGYFWDGWPNMRWNKNTSMALDRCCEIIRLLLESGFIVESNHEYIKKAQDKDYIPEPLRWIERKGDSFRFCWYYHENCYDEVKKLPASLYDKPCVIVPMEYYEEVVDFASINNFYMTNDAKNLLSEAKVKLDAILFFEDDEVIIDNPGHEDGIPIDLIDV